MPNARARFERIAHRGSPTEQPENTLGGFLVALDHGADAVELDVHTTKDGVVVVHHDPDVGNLAIAETDWLELSRLDVGGGAAMPRLDEVLEAIGSRATVYVELKGRGIEDEVIDVVQKFGDRYALHSFDHSAIARVTQKAPDIACGVLLDRGTKKPVAEMHSAAERTNARDVWPHWSLVDREFMKAARQLQRRVIAWTVNSVATAKELRLLGVDGICTDDVRMLANL